MISAEEALKKVLSVAEILPTESCPLEKAGGRILRENLFADRPYPPFDRAMKDGIALKFRENLSGKTLESAGVQAAGEAQKTFPAGFCAEVMTGAPVPAGYDAVIPYEELHFSENIVKINAENIRQGQNISLCGSDAGAGDLLVSFPRIIGAAEIATASSVGKTKLIVSRLSSVAVVGTGDEIVPTEKTPLPHQIRATNDRFLFESLRKDFGISADCFHLEDNLEKSKNIFAELANKYDIILTSGGVSAGKFDWVPEAMEAAGVRKIFHKVSQRPGKPLWFGRSEKVTVFGLPGNPISAAVNYLVYVRPFLRKLSGLPAAELPLAELTEDFEFAPALTFYSLADVRIEDGRLKAFRPRVSGSADFTKMTAGNGFLQLPAERSVFRKGELFPVLFYKNLSCSE